MKAMARRSFKNDSQAPFSPSGITALSGWLSLAQSSQAGDEWTPSIVDLLNAGSPMVQTGTVRRAAVGASANGFPTMVFDGTDVHLWPLDPAHSSTTKVGIWLWFKPATVAGVQRLYGVLAGVAGSTTNRLQLYTLSAALNCEAYASGSAGRFGTTPNVLVAGAWHAIYLQYDSSRGGDANLAIFVNGVSQSLTYGNVGAGQALATLPAASGSAPVGGGTDTDTTANPIANGGQIGPNMFAFNDNLSAAEIALFLAYQVPT